MVGGMQIVHIEQLHSFGEFSESKDWERIRTDLHNAITNVVWPPGSDRFTIYPQSGKKRGQGNGVKPIKDGLMVQLHKEGWKTEKLMDITPPMRPGKLDAVLDTSMGPFAVEWETGNISSSHRALNKMCLGLLKGKIIGGTLVVPSRDFSRYLTDRIGNWPELIPYLDLWKSAPIAHGILEVVVVEHDATSLEVPRIEKSTDGRAVN